MESSQYFPPQSGETMITASLIPNAENMSSLSYSDGFPKIIADQMVTRARIVHLTPFWSLFSCHCHFASNTLEILPSVTQWSVLRSGFTIMELEIGDVARSKPQRGAEGSPEHRIPLFCMLSSLLFRSSNLSSLRFRLALVSLIGKKASTSEQVGIPEHPVLKILLSLNRLVSNFIPKLAGAATTDHSSTSSSSALLWFCCFSGSFEVILPSS
jgi:hypothetical protein